ncbi:hypothetical protein D3C77_453290 [compost metagenome]
MHDTFKRHKSILAHTEVILVTETDFGAASAVQQRIHLFLSKFTDRHILRNIIMLTYRFQKLRIVVGRASRPSFKCALFNALIRVRNKQIRVNDHLRTESIAFRAGAEGTVEGEHTR